MARVIKDKRTGYLMTEFVKRHMTEVEIDAVIRGAYMSKEIDGNEYTAYLLAGQLYMEAV